MKILHTLFLFFLPIAKHISKITIFADCIGFIFLQVYPLQPTIYFAKREKLNIV